MVDVTFWLLLFRQLALEIEKLISTPEKPNFRQLCNVNLLFKIFLQEKIIFNINQIYLTLIYFNRNV
jgi:hypothetical protein